WASMRSRFSPSIGKLPVAASLRIPGEEQTFLPAGPASLRKAREEQTFLPAEAASLTRWSSMAVFFKVLFHFQGRHAARTGRGDGLAVPAVLHVAAGKNPGNAGKDLVRGA